MISTGMNTLLIDQTLMNLAQLSEKHGTDPTAAMKLFQKKLDYFSGSLWDMWEMQRAVEQANKALGNDCNSDGEEEDGGEEASPLDGVYTYWYIITPYGL